VHTSGKRDYLWTGRAVRSLRAIGADSACLRVPTSAKLRALLNEGGPVLFLKAGCWLIRPQLFEWPGPSATGRGLCAIGVAERPPSVPAGSCPSSPRVEAPATGLPDFPTPIGNQDGLAPALYLDDVAVRHVASRQPASLSEVHQIALKELRIIHYPLLDVYEDPDIRVLQVITALQRGGAERLTLDLVAELPALNVRTRLVTVGRPSRAAFPVPVQTIDLSNEGERAQALTRVAIRFGADLIHGHLLSGADMRSISQAGLPLMATIHNTREAWPEGLGEMDANDASLLTACSQAVERQLIASRLSIATRTAWNGINLNEFRPTPERLQSARELRVKWNFAPEDLVLVSVANPRPQKRLHLLPAILAAVRSSPGLKREVRLVLAGETAPGNSEAQKCVSNMRQEFSRLGLAPHVKWVGPISDVASLMAASDFLISTSAHEGLSLAQMEALAMGCDVVATDVGGAKELAAHHPRMHLLPVDASAAQFAEIITGIALGSADFQSAVSQGFEPAGHPTFSNPPQCLTPADWKSAIQRIGNPGSQKEILFFEQDPRVQGLSPDWSSRQMSRRYAWLYPRAIAAAQREKGEGLWLITNNFSTGGAQSSARRLLLGLAAEGIKVRAAVIEEERDHPTPGRRALAEAGICVETFEGANPESESKALEGLLGAIDQDKPRSVVFWNLRPNFKVLLADALLDVPVFDVSPGEMYFESLANFFAKPRPGLPYRTPRDYGARLCSVIVKYAAEARRAADVLGAPVHVVPNGVPLSTGAPPTKSGTAVVFGTAARINPRKRIEDLFEALRTANGRLPAYTLKIAGGIERGCEGYAQQLRDRAHGLPVEWLGEVRDVTGFHRDLDVFLMVSEPAGCPNASLEAMASGLPIIATDAGGASEQVVSGETGRLVPPRDAGAFAGALVELATQPGLRQAMGARGRGLVEERFSVQRMVSNYRRVCLTNGSDETRSDPPTCLVTKHPLF
jgi:glycosyltransferase involved in cell wall biosynthesis